jgi:putative transposase
VPRQRRYRLPGYPQHVVQRGNDRQHTFFAPADYGRYRDFLSRAAVEHCCAIHAYVLMTNHVHLLATPGLACSLPKMMQSIGRIYVQYFNATHRRTGTLWEGRYRAAIVDDENYLLTCMRYIELNPVRAQIVASPSHFPWSSFSANAYGAVDDLVVPHAIYRSLGPSPGTRQAAYRQLVGSPLPENELCSIRDATEHAWALGSTEFRSRITGSTRRAERLPVGRRHKQQHRDGRSGV